MYKILPRTSFYLSVSLISFDFWTPYLEILIFLLFKGRNHHSKGKEGNITTYDTRAQVQEHARFMTTLLELFH